MRNWLVDNEPDWTEAFTRASRYVGGDANLYQTTLAPWPSAEGYRVIWCRSSAQIDHDAETRRSRVAAGIAAIDEINRRLLSPKTRLKDVVGIAAAARAALEAFIDWSGRYHALGFDELIVHWPIADSQLGCD